MNKIFSLFLIPFLISSIAFFIFIFFVSKNIGKGALQVTSSPKSDAYLDGKLIGQTPFCKCDSKDMIPEGEYTIRLVPLDKAFKEFQEKIKITKSVLTVVDRTFGEGVSSEGSIITLTPIKNQKEMELMLISFPDNTEVFINNNVSGSTPLLKKNFTESDHEVRFAKNGYNEKTVRIHTVPGYRLSVLVFLGIDLSSPDSSSSSSFKPDNLATPSSSLVQNVVILKTSVGFLRVREEGSVSTKEIARVLEGEIYELVDEKNGWYQIKLKDGTLGWINGQYANKQ